MTDKVVFINQREGSQLLAYGVFCTQNSGYDEEVIAKNIYKNSAYLAIKPAILFFTKVKIITDEMIQSDGKTVNKDQIETIGLERVSKDLIENLTGGLYVYDNKMFFEVAQSDEVLDFVKNNNDYQLKIFEYEIDEYEEDPDFEEKINLKNT